MIVQWQDRSYTYDESRMTVAQASVIKLHTGHGIIAWELGVRAMDPADLQGLLWLIKAQNGEQCAIAELDFEPITLMAALRAAAEAESADAAAAGAVPTVPAVEPAPTAKSTSRTSVRAG